MALFSRLFQRRTAHARNRRSPLRNTFSPFGIQTALVESLENRQLLSALTVTTAADSGAGSLRAEIAAAHSGDTINFADSLNGQRILLTSGELVINKNLTIQGPGAGQMAIGGGDSRVFEVDGAKTTVTLSGLTIEYGSGLAEPAELGISSAFDGHGGGILNFGALTVSNCMLFLNYADRAGGGIDNQGKLTVNGSTLVGNQVGQPANGLSPPFGEGGGIANENGGTLTLNGSVLESNFAGDCGGGIYGGVITVNGSTLASNSAGDYGGGIYNYNTLTVSQTTLSNNVAGSAGGAIYNAYRATATIELGSTLSDNSAGDYGSGGGIYNAGLLKVSGSTLSANSADDGGAVGGGGGGIYNAKTGRLQLTSSTVTNNVAAFGADLYNLGQVRIGQDSTVGIVGP